MSHTYIFIDETGISENSELDQPLLGIGLLVVEDASRVTERLMQANFSQKDKAKKKRKELLTELATEARPVTDAEISHLLKSTKSSEYKFSSLGEDIIDRYKRFLDIVFEYKWRFYGGVIEKKRLPYDSERMWNVYIKGVKKLIQKNLTGAEPYPVITDAISTPSHTDKSLEDELETLPQISSAIRTNSAAFPLIQFTDLLIGAVVFQWKDKRKLNLLSKRTTLRREFIEYLFKKLSIPTSSYKKHPLNGEIVNTDKHVFKINLLKIK